MLPAPQTFMLGLLGACTSYVNATSHKNLWRKLRHRFRLTDGVAFFGCLLRRLPQLLLPLLLALTGVKALHGVHACYTASTSAPLPWELSGLFCLCPVNPLFEVPFPRGFRDLALQFE
mmetsp:Transcript_87706/g.146257  ORF Transcript_87706/g.146257 Transcript_87706/m.146257 type:complete len:118 (+) Transcript_87706:1349-1702(+)